MGCSTEGCVTQNIFARGMCQACYYRLRRNGTVARKNMVRSSSCTYPGCTKAVLGRNLCTTHYRRAQHPLTTTWKLLRSRNKGLYPPTWDRFDAFLADVGERPAEDHKLKRVDGLLPYSKENVRWTPPIPVSVTKSRKAYHAAYGREWNLRQFGIDSETYERVLAEQNGVCAICQQPETVVLQKTGEPKALAVDHDVLTGAVRGLLCQKCNPAIGLLDHDVERLKRAVAYLNADIDHRLVPRN